MAEALALAARGLGRTFPNPPVGAVVVAGGEVVGRGWHPKAGEPHAEIFALREAGERARGATMYVTLEPCSHHGRTPPCAEAVLAAGLARVEVGCLDPNPKVAGRGAARLREAGIVVVVHDLPEAAELISGFRSWVVAGRPEVILKAAMSLDGQLAPASGVSRWITGPESRGRVHRARDRADAVLTGSGTVLVDDPSLTVRTPPPSDGRQPFRIILDRRGRIPGSARCLGPGSLVLAGRTAGPGFQARVEAAGAEFLALPAGDGPGFLAAVFSECGRRGLTRVLVEAGPGLSGALLAAGLVDRVMLFVAPIFLGEAGYPLTRGLEVPELSGAIRLEGMVVERIGADLLVEGRLPAAARGAD